MSSYGLYPQFSCQAKTIEISVKCLSINQLQKKKLHQITPVIHERLGRGVPNNAPRFRQLCFKFLVTGGEPIAIQGH